MHRCRRSLAFSVLGALALAGLAVAAGLPTYTLRLHRGKGDTATYEFTSVSTDKVSGPGAPAGAITSNAQLTCTIGFQGVSPGGRIIMEAKVKEGRVKETVGGETQTLPVKTSSATYVLTPRSEVKQAELTSGSPAQLSPVGLTFSADDAFLPPPLPDKPVKVGDRWESSARIPAITGHPGDVREAKYASRVLGEMSYAGRSCLKVRTSFRQSQHATVQAPDGRGTATVKVQSKGEGTWLFDPKAGLIMESEATGTMTITRVVKMPGQQDQLLTVSSAIRSRAKMTGYNGKALVIKSSPARVKRR
jgi:hypothetical protein